MAPFIWLWSCNCKCLMSMYAKAKVEEMPGKWTLKAFLILYWLWKIKTLLKDWHICSVVLTLMEEDILQQLTFIHFSGQFSSLFACSTRTVGQSIAERTMFSSAPSLDGCPFLRVLFTKCTERMICICPFEKNEFTTLHYFSCCF